jgi:hypothetical protein
MPAVQLPFAFVPHRGVMTISEELRLDETMGEVVTASPRDADSTVAEQLWQTLQTARTGDRTNAVADLEDAVFRNYLPMARTLARSVIGGSVDRRAADEAAELGLARAVLAWRQPTGGGFRRFARATILRQLQDCVWPRPASAGRSARAAQPAMLP